MASLILRKLGAYPRQNGLALALRELGFLERTLFTLQWLQSPELRQRVQLGLNKGEAKNALARAVFFNRLGELRDRSFENQRYRASGLNLVVAAIVLWNTVNLGRAVHGLREQSVDEYLLAHLSPLGWEHIKLIGDHVWHSNKRGGQGPISTLAKPQRFSDASVYATTCSLACFIFRFVQSPPLASARLKQSPYFALTNAGFPAPRAKIAKFPRLSLSEQFDIRLNIAR